MLNPQAATYGTHTIHPKMHSAEAMNRILRGEISAVEAYQQVIDKISKDPEHVRLHEFLDHHADLVAYWERQVLEEHMMPDDSSGPWGYVVEAFVGTAKLFGSAAALRALKEGEEHGLKEYQNFLRNDYVAEEHKRYVRDTVIPNLQRHINSIEAMLKMA